MLSIGDVIPTQKIALDRQTLCQPREEGGLGNWKTKIMNEAMIVKQVWRIAQNPNTDLVARTFNAKYFPKTFFFFHVSLQLLHHGYGEAFSNTENPWLAKHDGG